MKVRTRFIKSIVRTVATLEDVRVDAGDISRRVRRTFRPEIVADLTV